MLAQTTLRAVLGQHELDEMLSERKKLSTDVQSILDAQTETWGIKVEQRRDQNRRAHGKHGARHIIKPFLDLLDKAGKPAGANGATRVPLMKDVPPAGMREELT